MIGDLERLTPTDAADAFAHGAALAAGCSPAAANHPWAELIAERGAKFSELANATGRKVAAAASAQDTGAMLERIVRVIASDEGSYDLRHRSITGRLEVQDFVPQRVVRLGAGGKLALRREGAPAQGVELETASESVKLATYANAAVFSRQAVINCEWDLLRQTTLELVGAAYRRERAEVLAVLASNPTLGDGTALFSTDRGNDRTTSAAVSVATLEAMMNALREMSGTLRELESDAGEPLELEPAVWAVPAERELLARQVLREVDMRDRISVFASTGIAGYSYLFPNPEQHPALARVNLRGVKAPDATVGKRHRGDDDFRVKVVYDVGAAAISPRAVRQALT
jgi:hypothetical protein